MSADVIDSLKIREAAEAPTACSSCGGQYLDRRHVDFGASWDGPVLNAEQVVATGIAPVAIDDLVICEECVRAGAMILGMVDDDGSLAQLRGQLAKLAEDLGALKTYSRDLEIALASKPKKET